MSHASAIRRTLIAWIALEVLRAIASFVFPIDAAPSGWRWLAWIALTDLIVVVAIGFAAVRSDWRGWRLGAAVAAIPFTVAVVNIVEGHFYLSEAHLQATRLALQVVLMYAVLIPIWARVFGGDRPAQPPGFRPFGSRTWVGRAWRFVVCDFIYIFVYLAAGLTILPLVREFYAQHALPSLGVIFALQLLLRGPLFIVLCVLLVRMMGMPRAKGAMAIGVIFTLVSGVAPLLLPSPYFPDNVRWVHFFEVSLSNLVFGALAAAIWGAPRRVPAA
jgi:hypothetical protein